MPETWKRWEGQVVDGFLLRQCLGESDHSAVFLTDKQAAIKLVSLSPEQQATQLHRWDATKKLKHPNLLRVLQTGKWQMENAGLAYAVMEYAEENLAEILRERALTPAEVRELLPQVLGALSYIHSQGLVHAHLQPSNIMASGDRVKLAIDGVRAAGESGRAGLATIYAPPEVEAGEPLTPASDVWSLGVTLVEALTQRLPERAGAGDLAVSHEIPAPFLEMAEHCLVRDPRRRWSVAELAARLHPGPLPPERQPVPRPQAALAKRSLPLAAVVVALLLLTIFFGAKLVKRHSQAQANLPEAATPAALATQTAVAAGQNPSGTSAAATFKGANAPGSVAEKVLPDVPSGARNTIQGRVRVKVRVSVDSSGKVIATRLASVGPSKYFANLALRAAERWKFTPPRQADQDAASVWMLKFEFGRGGTDVQPTQMSP